MASSVATRVLVLTAAGIGSGLLAGISSQRFLGSLLFAVKATEPAIAGLPLIFIVAAAVLAAVPPIWRAVRIDPVKALRSD